MRSSRLLASAAIIAIAIFSASAIDGKHINGRAVSAQWRWGRLNWGNPPGCPECGIRFWKGSIDLFTIANGRVSKTDTLFNRKLGFAYYPAFDITGTKVAFFRYGTGSLGTVNGGKNTIAAIDIDGNNLADLCTTPGSMDFGESWGGLDWPAGDWIYYTLPQAGNSGGSGSVEIWKVNYRTHENVKVFKTTDNTGINIQCHFYRRWQLDLAGDKMGAQGPFPEYLCTEKPAGLNGVCNFPLPNGNLSAANAIGFCGCNAAISASGNFGNNWCGSHANLYINHVTWASNNFTSITVTLDQLAQWSGDSFGRDAELVRWAVNSDKWVLQQAGWYGHADDNSWGSNMVAGNWVDQAAIRISNNPKQPQNNNVTGGGDGTIYLGNEAGDLWVDGGAENAGKYEDEAGVWHAVPGYAPTGVRYIPVSTMVSGREAVSVGAAGSVRIDLPSNASASIAVHDVLGRSIRTLAASGPCMLPAGTINPGMYIVSAQVNGRSFSTIANIPHK